MNVVQAPNPILRFKTKPVKKVSLKYHEIIKDMIKLTKTFVDPEGVGLASTQIGNNEQYFIMKEEDESFTAVFNPLILEYSKPTKVYFEGCLSIPNYYGEVKRHIWVKVRYTDKDGNKVETKLSGVPAWIYQHEYDHLQGVLFMDRILEQKSRLFKVSGRDRSGAEVFEEVPL